MRVYSNIHEAYVGTLSDVLHNYDYVTSPRGMLIREKVDYAFKVVKPTAEPVITKDAARNIIIEEYTRKEVALYDSCSNKVEDFAKASKFWEKIANADGTINSAYGHLIWAKKSHGNPAFSDKMVTPWTWALNSLVEDKDTRQAILRFSLPEHAYPGVQDFTCTMNGNFLIRDNRLHFTISMRSNDLVKGLAYDMSWFVSLMDRMLIDLRGKYPYLTKGNYTHFANSSHIYMKDEEMVKKMIGEQ